MSIIMSCSEPMLGTARANGSDLSIRELLDHIAVELAHEYVRLMERSADVDTGNRSADPGKGQ
jgi:hypothetical protein